MNVLNGWKYEFDAIIPQAGKPVDKSVWYMNPQDVCASLRPNSVINKQRLMTTFSCRLMPITIH
jgi:predicted metalloendopeptidase